MLRSVIVATLALAFFASPALAQSRDPFPGTWAFQTGNYGNGGVTRALSGAAVITRVGGGSYSVRLTAHEITAAPGQGERVIWAAEDCSGQLQGAQLIVTCTVTDTEVSYAPDNFVLQRGANSNELVGDMQSAASASVVWQRVR